MSSRPEDPTQTLTIRNRVNARIGKIFTSIKKDVVHFFKNDDGLFINAFFDAPQSFQYEYTPAKQRAFKAILNRSIKYNLIDTNTQWLREKFTEVAYRGAIKAVTAAKNVTPNIDPNIAFSMARSRRAELVFTRFFQQLEGITASMESIISTTLMQGILQGKGIDGIVKDLGKACDLSKTRAQLITRTEIVRGHSIATIETTKAIQPIIGEVAKYIWLTAIDGRERETHRIRNNTIYTEKQVVALIGEPGCRCAISPWYKDMEDSVDDFKYYKS